MWMIVCVSPDARTLTHPNTKMMTPPPPRTIHNKITTQPPTQNHPTTTITGRGARSHYRKKGVVVDVPTPGEATVRLEDGGLILEGAFMHVYINICGGCGFGGYVDTYVCASHHTVGQSIHTNFHTQTYTGVKARHLETALPPTGGVVLVLRGPHRLKKAKYVYTCMRVYVYICIHIHRHTLAPTHSQTQTYTYFIHIHQYRLLESDTRREEGVVQLREDLQVVTLPLDDIAEYRCVCCVLFIYMCVFLCG